MSNDIKQEPVAVISQNGFLQLNDDKYVGNLYRDHQPAPDVEAMQARIAELERELKESDAALIESRANDSEAMRQLNELRQHKDADLKSLRDHCKELERVQEYERWLLKRILDALPQNRDWLDPAIERAALAAVQKPEGGA